VNFCSQTSLLDSKNFYAFYLEDISDSEVNSMLASAYGLPNGTLFGLEDFNYQSDALTNITFGHLSNTSFNGITVRILRSYLLCGVGFYIRPFSIVPQCAERCLIQHNGDPYNKESFCSPT
jgi:hypothetical protein